MLSAFRAQPIYELKQQDKTKIESVLAFGDRLLVGLNSGALRIYRVNEPTAEPEPEQDGGDGGDGSLNDARAPRKVKSRVVDLLREEDKFSRRPVQQLAIIKEANILVSLSDSYVSIHDLQTYALQERLDRTRGATAFAVTSNVVKDADTGVPGLVSRLAVAVKRRILVWTWQDMELTPEVQDMALPHSVKSLIWATGTRMMVGLDPGFSLVDIETQQTTDIYKPGASGEVAGQAGVRFGAVNSSGMGYMGMGSWVPKPMATNLANGHLLLAKDVNTLFIDADGTALEKRQIPWYAAPEALGFSYPYLLSLQQTAKGALDVRNPDTLSLLQTIALPNASILHVPQPNISLPHAGKGFLVASDRCIWRMAALSYDVQIDELVAKKRFDEAISLLGQLEHTLLRDKEGRIREIMMLKAQALFHQQKYRPALDLFADASAPPARVIALYPKSIAGELSTIESSVETSEAEQAAEEASPTEDVGAKTEDAPKEIPAAQQKSYLAMLKGSGKKIDSDSASVRSVKTASEASPQKPAKVADKPLEGADLRAAVLALCSFLAQSRVQIQKYLTNDGTLKASLENGKTTDSPNPPFSNLIDLPEDLDNPDWQAELLNVAKLVDTTLFRSYMHALPSLAGPLFRLDNFCDPHVVEEKLYESGRYNDLIDFLHGKKLHREALELLEKFGNNEAAEEVMPALRGPNRTVGYLQQLPPEMIDIILEFALWPIRTDPDKGMEIFLADTENAEGLPRAKVLDFLRPLDNALAVKYLEHVINELNDTTPDFHQKLVDIYLERLRGKDIADKTERDQARDKLEEFLRQSTRYNKVKTFKQLPSDDPDLFESRAIVLSAMGNHKQALQIYVFQLRDTLKAEAYCNKIYLQSQIAPSSPSEACPYPPSHHHTSAPTTTNEKPFTPFDPEDSTQPNIYTILLGLYLKPPPPEQVQWPPALDLLSKHGARLPASSTLDLMSSDLEVRELEKYFRGRIRNANSVLREERIIRGLKGVRKVEVERELLLGSNDGMGSKTGGRSRRVVIREDDHCKICHKRFGASAIRVYPDNQVIHYGCVGRSGVQRMRTADLEGMRRVPWA
ncbi:hypothetical protein MBLNU459_g8115t1 [Dothideomycetes sp. NU459]